jgi:hypothetical protein
MQAWSPWSEADKASLEKIQQHAVKMVSGLKGVTYEERITELGLPTLEERRHQSDMAMVHKILQGPGQLDHTVWFEKAGEGPRATRSGADPNSLKIVHGRLEVRRNFFSERVISDWNKIPKDVKSILKTDSFRTRYKMVRASQMQPAT